jgi:periplasmic divalent cation tolerance protein
MTEIQSNYLLVVTTSDDKERLQTIGRRLVEQRLAACAQISGPIESHYAWKGKVETASEWVCTVKTTRDAWPRVCSAIQESHNYETPEIVSLTIEDGSAAYLRWISDCVDG